MKQKVVDYDREHALISRIVEEGDAAMRRVLRDRMNSDFLTDTERKEQFAWLLNKYQKKGAVPSLSLFTTAFPDFETLNVRDNLPLIVEAIKEKKAYNDVQSILSRVNKESKTDIKEALRLLKEDSMHLTQRHTSSERKDLTQAGKDILLAYKQNKTLKGMHGVPYIWPRANKVTRGKKDGQLVGYYGRTGTMKTWLLLADAAASHKQYGRVIQFITREMLIEEIEERWAVLTAGVSYEDYQDGTLDSEDEKKLSLAIEEMKDTCPFYVTTVEGDGLSALAEMRAGIEETGAELTYVDGVYFYSSGDYKDFAVVCNGLKQLALQTKTCIVSSNQANTQKSKDALGETDDVGGGQSYAQACDVLIRTFCEKQNEENEELVLKFKKVRKGKRCTFTINAKPGADFSQKFDEENEEELEATLDDTEGALQ